MKLFLVSSAGTWLFPSLHMHLAVAVWSHIFLAWCLTQTLTHRRRSIHTCRITARCSWWSSLICRSCDFLYELLHMKCYSFSFCLAKIKFVFIELNSVYSQPFHFPFPQVFPSHPFSGTWSHLPACLVSLMLFQIHWGATLPLSKSPGDGDYLS